MWPPLVKRKSSLLQLLPTSVGAMKAVVEGIAVKVLTEGRRFDLKKADEINRNSVQQKRPAGPKTAEAKKPAEKVYARPEDATVYSVK